MRPNVGEANLSVLTGPRTSRTPPAWHYVGQGVCYDCDIWERLHTPTIAGVRPITAPRLCGTCAERYLTTGDHPQTPGEPETFYMVGARPRGGKSSPK